MLEMFFKVQRDEQQNEEWRQQEKQDEERQRLEKRRIRKALPTGWGTPTQRSRSSGNQSIFYKKFSEDQCKAGGVFVHNL